MSAVCAFLTEGCYRFDYFRLSSFWEPVIYFYCSSIQSLFAPIIIITKKPHSSQQFLMWNPWHVLHLHQLFLYVMNWTWAFLHFSKCPCSSVCAPYFNHVSDHLPTFWWMPPPAMERIRSENSSDDKGQRRSTRWPTPAHFLFKSASTAGSCKLFPVRRGLPVVLCWL